MRIRGRKPLSTPSAAMDHPVSSSPSPSSSLSSSSSITAANSPLASSQDSSNSYPFSLFATTTHRCHGLDLLVKAIYQVNGGSVIGVPYIQRRVTIRRRRRELHVFCHLFEQNNGKENEKNSINSKKQKKGNNSTGKKGMRVVPAAIREEICRW